VDLENKSKPERKTPIQYTNAYIWNLELIIGKDPDAGKD